MRSDRRIPGIAALALAMALGGCAGWPDEGLTKSAVQRDDVALRAVLAYARTADDFDAAAYARELKTLAAQPDAPMVTLQRALLSGQDRSEADPARAVALLDKLLADTSADAVVFHPLARILHGQYSARVRLLGSNEKLAREQREARAEADTLKQKLDALTDIERSLHAPAGSPTETPP
ncbi:MAG: hypothetical protein KDF24_10815 [Rhodocyclaceae bacterium]|nr:hypothetical protein [Rhodocyclaceae bacterium]